MMDACLAVNQAFQSYYINTGLLLWATFKDQYTLAHFQWLHFPHVVVVIYDCAPRNDSNAFYCNTRIKMFIL